ncbi:Mitogen-activated protein kinase, partial [Perkinsus olseni]
GTLLSRTVAYHQASEPESPPQEEEDLTVTSSCYCINYVTFATASGRSIPVDSRYTDVKVIGTGSYGTVLSAKDSLAEVTGVGPKEVAVKHTVLVEDKLDVEDWPDIVRIIREVELLRDFHHENLLSLTDVFPQPSGYAMTNIGIVTPMCKGGTLATYQPRSLAQVMAFTRQILSALSFMHSHNVLHRDIKRDNLFVTEGGRSVVLGDFGLARERRLQLLHIASIVRED